MSAGERGLEEGDGATDEVVELGAAEQAVGEEGEIDNLLDEGLAFGIAGGVFLDFAAQMGHLLVVALNLVLLIFIGRAVGGFLADGFGGIVGCRNGIEVGLQRRQKGFVGIFDDALDYEAFGVDNQVVAIGELSVETHAGLHCGHVFHSTHILILCDENRVGIGRKGFE